MSRRNRRNEQDKFKYYRLYIFDKKLLNWTSIIGIIAFVVVTSIMGSFSWRGLVTIIVLIFLLLLLFAINDYIYRAIARKEDINISVFPTSSELNRLEEELRILEALNKEFFGVFRVMSKYEKFAFTVSILLFAVGSWAVVVILPLKSFNTMISWLSISAFGLSLMPIIETGARNRLTQKISSIQSKINTIKERRNENTLNKILNIVERLKK